MRQVFSRMSSRRFGRVICISFMYSSSLLASPWLLPIAAPEYLDFELDLKSHLQSGYQAERWLNESDGYAGRENWFWRGQNCIDLNRDWLGCIGVQEQADNLKASSFNNDFTTRLRGESEKQQLLATLAYGERDDFQLAGKLNYATEDQFAIQAQLQKKPWQIKAGLEKGDTRLRALGYFDLEGRAHNINLESAAPWLKWSLSSIYLEKDYRFQLGIAKAEDDETAYLDEKYAFSLMPVASGLTLEGNRSYQYAEGTLKLEDQNSHTGDQWHGKVDLRRYYLGYLWHYSRNSYWLGVNWHKALIEEDGKIVCSGKSWLPEGDNTNPCDAFTGGIVYAEANGSTQMTMLSARVGRKFAMGWGQFTWDNLLGEAIVNSHSSEYLGGFGQTEKRHQSNEYHPLWVLGLGLDTSWRDLAISYQWQQIIPLNNLDAHESGDVSSGSGAGDTGSSESYRRDWLWPLPGGYHQLQIRYEF